MFHRSLRDNIAFARPGATDEEIHAAAAAAYVMEFADQLFQLFPPSGGVSAGLPDAAVAVGWEEAVTDAVTGKGSPEGASKFRTLFGKSGWYGYWRGDRQCRRRLRNRPRSAVHPHSAAVLDRLDLRRFTHKALRMFRCCS
ncbi:hypothetical protein [Streptomyces sp. NPDC054834]